MEFCHTFGTGVSLATIETREENESIENWLVDHGDPSTGAWLGGSANGHHSRWSWFPTGQLIQWFDWGPSQPSGGDQHCLYTVGGFLGYQWADFHCDFQMTFLCEYNGRRNYLDEHHRAHSETSKVSSITANRKIPMYEDDMLNVTNENNASNFTKYVIRDSSKEKEEDTEAKVESVKKAQHVETNDSKIEVIANNASSVILFKKVATRKSEKLKSDNVSWSIFEMLKNVIRMPFQNLNKK